jgi:membrane-bound inhibitor of C-type lysozyme
MPTRTSCEFTAFALGAALCVLPLSSSANAQSGLSVPLALGRDGSVNAVRYRCGDGTDLTVQYINAGANSLAMIPLKGETLIFVSVVSQSGVRYVSGASEWYIKDTEATLSGTLSDAPSVTCTATG